MRMRKFKWFWYAMLASMVVAIALFALHQPLLEAYARSFHRDTARPGANALVVLGGNIHSRLPAAIDLYRQDYAPRVVLTDIRPTTTRYPEILLSETRMAQQVLDTEDIPWMLAPSARGGATSTFDEAVDLARLCEQEQWRHLILVTDAFHSQRAHYAFVKIFDKMGVPARIDVHAAPNRHYSSEDWWTSERGLTDYLLEPAKALVYRLRSENIAGIREY